MANTKKIAQDGQSKLTEADATEIWQSAVTSQRDDDAPLYQKREKVHPKRVWGRYRKLKWLALIVLLAIYYITPWLRWDRGPGVPDQAILIDMAGRRGFFFSVEIWPQEIYFLAGLLIVAALGLFLVTSLFGRVWCGFACPQTVWTDFYVWVERFIEGDRAARMRLDKAPWSLNKLYKRVAKHVVWLLIALVTGGAWIMYFTDAPQLVTDIATLELDLATLFFIGLFTATTYLLAGFGREQVCTYMCPWPRIQSAMMDEYSMIVTYETWRGEPRDKPARDGNYESRGHCIDCNNCVVVCPMGIDIRDGNQLECIGCGLCIDACNNVMDKLGLPRELITYDSVARQQTRSVGKSEGRALVRARTVIYGLLMFAAMGVMAFAFANRSQLDVNVLRDRNPLFVTLKDGSVRNGYTFKILNKTREEQTYVLTLKGLDGGRMKAAGHEWQGNRLWLDAEPDSVKTYKLYVTAPLSSLSGERTDITFLLRDVDDPTPAHRAVNETVFIGPEKR